MGNVKDLTGSRIGKLLLLQRKRENNKTYYYCKCDCGNEKWIRADKIGEDKINNCGCERVYHYTDLSNKKFGKLQPIKVVDNSKNNGYIWLCKCDCGNEKEIVMSSLISGASTSCGCIKKNKAKDTVKIMHERNRKYLIDNTCTILLSRKNLLKNNISGVNGVTWDKTNQKWHSYISFKKKRYHLGFYKDKKDAISARKEAEEKLHNKFLEWYYQNYKK